MLKRNISLCLGIDLFTLAVLLLVSTSVSQTEITLECEHPVNLKSTNYPHYYGNEERIEWRVKSLSEERMLVVFSDIKMGQTSDSVTITDLLHTANRRSYTDYYEDAPSFLSLGHVIEIKFSTDDRITATGFNLTVHCYKSFPMLSLRTMSGGTSPGTGLLEVYQAESEVWLPACAHNWDSHTARTACRQLGYPEVSVYKSESSFNPDKQAFVLSHPCGKDMGVLQECSSNVTTCPSLKFISLKCHRPGYQGCFKIANFQDNAFANNISSVEDCLLTCIEQQKTLSFIRQDECFCLNATEGRNLLDSLPSEAKNEDRCNNSCSGKSNELCGGAVAYPAWYSVYNATIGFCDLPNKSVLHGQWSRNGNVFFGSSSTLTCDEGYNVNGSQTVQCVPGQSPYKPRWNSTFPSCLKEETDVQPTSSEEGSWRWTVVISVLSVVSLIIFVAFLVYVHKRRHKRRSPHEVAAETTREESDISTPVPCTQEQGDCPTKTSQDPKDPCTEERGHSLTKISPPTDQNLSNTMQNRPLPQRPGNDPKRSSKLRHSYSSNNNKTNTNTNTNENTNANSNTLSKSLRDNESHHPARNSSRKIATAGSTPHVRSRRSKNERVSNADPAIKLDCVDSIDVQSEVSYAVPDGKKPPVKPRRYASKIYKNEGSKGQSITDEGDVVITSRSSMLYARINHQVPLPSNTNGQDYEAFDLQHQLLNCNTSCNNDQQAPGCRLQCDENDDKCARFYQTLEDECKEPENGAQIYEDINADP